MSRKKNSDESKPGAPLWMTTYGDMVTLLLTFFILLFSFSSIDAQKWQTLVASFQGTTGVLEGGISLSNGKNTKDQGNKNPSPGSDSKGNKDGKGETDKEDDFTKLYSSLKDYMIDNDITAEVILSPDSSEILLRFRDYVLFETGKAELGNASKTILDKVAQVILDFEKNIDKVRVEGHTDIRPIKTSQFPTNWELSGARAVRVVRYFQESHSFPGNKLSFQGYGEYMPIAANDNEENMAKNRRVDILIVKAISEIDYVDIKKEF